MKPLDKHIISIIELPPVVDMKLQKLIPASPTTVGSMETCPMKFNGSYGVTIDKVPYQQNDAAVAGQLMHEAAEDFLKMGLPISDGMKQLYPTLAERANLYRNHPNFDPLLVESSLQVNADGPCTWWQRAMGVKADLLMKIMEGKGIFYMDWKTQGTHSGAGKYKPPKLDYIQTEMTGLSAFMADPELQVVVVIIEFVKHGQQIKVMMKRDKATYSVLDHEGNTTEMNYVLPAALRRYWHVQRTKQFAPKPSGLCNGWCEVVVCPHNNPKRVK